MRRGGGADIPSSTGVAASEAPRQWCPPNRLNLLVPGTPFPSSYTRRQSCVVHHHPPHLTLLSAPADHTHLTPGDTSHSSFTSHTRAQHPNSLGSPPLQRGPGTVTPVTVSQEVLRSANSADLLTPVSLGRAGNVQVQHSHMMHTVARAPWHTQPSSPQE